jgi:hypothetical protein
MRFIEVSSNRFINPEQVVEFIYEPQSVRQKKEIDYSDQGKEKSVSHDVPSSLTIKLVCGEPLRFLGPEADSLSAKLKNYFAG